MNSIPKVRYIAVRGLGFDLSPSAIKMALAECPLQLGEEVMSIATNNAPDEPQVWFYVCRTVVHWP